MNATHHVVNVTKKMLGGSKNWGANVDTVMITKRLSIFRMFFPYFLRNLSELSMCRIDEGKEASLLSVLVPDSAKRNPKETNLRCRMFMLLSIKSSDYVKIWLLFFALDGASAQKAMLLR